MVGVCWFSVSSRRFSVVLAVLGGSRQFSVGQAIGCFSAVLGGLLEGHWRVASCGEYWALSVSLLVVSGFADVGLLLLLVASGPDVVGLLLFVVLLVVCTVFCLGRRRSPGVCSGFWPARSRSLIVCSGFWLGHCRSPIACNGLRPGRCRAPIVCCGLAKYEGEGHFEELERSSENWFLALRIVVDHFGNCKFGCKIDVRNPSKFIKDLSEVFGSTSNVQCAACSTLGDPKCHWGLFFQFFNRNVDPFR